MEEAESPNSFLKCHLNRKGFEERTVGMCLNNSGKWVHSISVL